MGAAEPDDGSLRQRRRLCAEPAGGARDGRTLAADLHKRGESAHTEAGAAVQQSFRSALHTVADALSAHGFAAHTDHRNNQLRIVNNHCPFGDVAIDNPVVCAVDRGLVKGMLRALYGETEPSIDTSLPHGDQFCVTSFVN